MKKRLRLITIAFTVSFAMMAALSLFALKQFASLVDYSEQVDHTNSVISRLYRIENMVQELDLKEREYMLTKDKSALRELLGVSRQILPATESLRNSVAKDESQSKNLTLLRVALVSRRDFLYQNLQFLDTSGVNRLSFYFYQEREARRQCIKYLDNMHEWEQTNLRNKFRSKLYYQQITSSTMRYLLSIFAGITIILFLFMMRELRQRMSYHDELQLNIADLRRSHAELEQIAFAVSHHLQEPLRKIRIFSNRMLYKKRSDVDEATKMTLERINDAAARMQELIDDLMNLTSLVKEESMEDVNLNDILRTTVKDLELKIEEKSAIIHTEALPVIKGHRLQVQILFKSLLDNALKFGKDGVPPVISIRCDRVSGAELKELNLKMDQQSFYRVTVADNGIGFDNKFISKMFRIFQRLHTEASEYTGKGIGLPVCQRVMVNHGGYILAHGHPGVGATFRLYFPIKE